MRRHPALEHVGTVTHPSIHPLTHSLTTQIRMTDNGFPIKHPPRAGHAGESSLLSFAYPMRWWVVDFSSHKMNINSAGSVVVIDKCGWWLQKINLKYVSTCSGTSSSSSSSTSISGSAVKLIVHSWDFLHRLQTRSHKLFRVIKWVYLIHLTFGPAVVHQYWMIWC